MNMENSDDIFDPVDHAKWLPPREIFARLGYVPPPVETLDDYQLPGRLWELIYALAGRRIFLYWTNHLDDRTLYGWLQKFIDEPEADVSPEAESNCRVDVSEGGTGLEEGLQCWLRFYADEEMRRDFARDDPGLIIPPHEDPPFAHDYFLPVPPTPRPEAHWDRSDVEDDPESDPLGLERVDQEIRIENLHVEINEITGGAMKSFEVEDVPPQIEEPFLEQVRDIERHGWTRPIEQLSAEGVGPIPPDELTDEAVSAKLWELLHNLACRSFYCVCSDHLSDREMYVALWKEGLREEVTLPGRRLRTGGWFHDFIGGCSDEDMEIYHRYYADEETRARHAKEFPGLPMPPRETPPYHRDWRLPKGPF